MYVCVCVCVCERERERERVRERERETHLGERIYDTDSHTVKPSRDLCIIS